MIKPSVLCSLLLPAAIHAAPPIALPKTGVCPAGYATIGGYCKPGRSSTHAVARTGGCSSGFRASGGYCVAAAAGRRAIAKTGACPAGWQASGNYCVERN